MLCEDSARDREHPGCKLLGSIHGVDAPEDNDEDILGGVVGVDTGTT